MQVLITGGSGFVGRHLSSHLERQGGKVVSVSSNPAENTNGIRDFRLLDIREETAVATLIDHLKPPQVYHLAAITSISAATSDERAAFDVNVWGTRNILSAVSKLHGSARVLNVSTSQVYGESVACPLVESANLEPQNSYAVTKAMAELLCQRFSANCEIINVRPFNHSGPGQSTQFVLSYMAHEIAAIELGQQKPVIRTGDLSVRRDFTDVRDVVRAYVLLLEKGTPGQTYNICSGQSYLLSDALDYLLSQSTARIEVEQDHRKTRKGEASTFYGSFEKLSSDTCWHPAISFDQMLRDTLQYWRETLVTDVPSQDGITNQSAR
jgi:GDP-4-dehydro-6-deoxy-D-mannose reductase